MSWSDGYVGLPEAQANCWGLVVQVYDVELGIRLPSYAGVVVGETERAEIAGLITAEAGSGPWIVTDTPPAAFDVLVFRRGHHRSHVGIAVDAHHMLHMRGQALVERFDVPGWKTRLTGIYRHVETPVQAPLEGAA